MSFQNTRLTRGARPALAGFFRARQYPCARITDANPGERGAGRFVASKRVAALAVWPGRSGRASLLSHVASRDSCQYPCSRFLVYDLAAHELVVPATMMMLQYSMGLLQQIVRPQNRKYA